MLKLENLSKVFRTSEVETTALNSVDLSISAGEFVAIMGPSGCGKSTLLNIIGLLDNPTSGSYRFLGEEVSQYPERKLARLRKHNIGFIFQSFNLIDELTVFGNVELPLLYQKVPAAERRERVEAMLEKVGIMSRRDHLPQQLSGGQQQRVAVARALVGNPKLILADEPTGNLDSANGEEVMNMLVALNAEGTTIVMVTHSHPHAQYAQRTVRMLDGRVLTETTTRAALAVGHG
ncbi:MAG TPA: ABC transporter ATP-binding protein [Gammaproteobacteria bacterium]